VRLLVATGMLVAAALCQSLIGRDLPVVQGRPDLPLVVVLAWSMLRGSSEGAFAGFVGGFLLDIVSYTPFGINAALLGLLGYAAGLPEANVYRGNLPFFLLTAAFVTLGYHTGVFVLLQASGLAMPPILDMYSGALRAAMLNALLLAPTFVLCRRLLRMMAGFTQLRL
jgi:rod shape-determining protein MreD